MKKFLGLLIFACASLVQAQLPTGQIISSQYQYVVNGYAANTYTFSPATCNASGPQGQLAFYTNAPITIVDGNPALTETVTPSQVIYNGQTCALTIAPLNSHQLPWHIISGTGGLQEALNLNATSPVGNTVILDAAWYQSVGTANAQAVIASVQGSTQLSLIDVTTAPNSAYHWNGTQYVAVGTGGGANTPATTLLLKGTGGANGVVAAIPGTDYVIPSGSITGNAGTATALAAAGTTCPGTTPAAGGVDVHGNAINCVAVGSSGSGNLGTLPNDLLTNNSNNTAAQDIYNFIATVGYAPQLAVTAAATNNGVATIMPSASGAFTNTSNVKVHVEAIPSSARSVMEWGAQCNTRAPIISLVSGSTTATIYADFFYPADVGKTLVAVGTVGGVPTAFETTITAIIGGGSTATMATAAPFTFSAAHETLGTDDTAAIQQAFNQANTAPPGTSNLSSTTTLTFPASNCLTHTITYTGVSFRGVDPAKSQWTGFPGEDILQAPDPSLGSSASGNGVSLRDITANVDSTIDATLPWQIVNSAGTTAKTGLSRPTGIKTAVANNPLGPGWFQGSGPNLSGAYNGVASVTAGSNQITIPASIALPIASNQIVFPYLSTVFTTTVSSVNSGTRVATLAVNMPAGSTGTQVEWFAGTSVQNLATAVSGGTCPTTITLNNPITPSPATESNVGPFGLIQIDAEQFTYFGKTNAGNLGSQFLTITGCAQNGTARAAHSINATVVPLNPYKPSTPWPVGGTINSGQTTPVNAAFYPAWNVGNSFFAAPVSNGATGLTGVGSFANAVIDGITVNGYPSANSQNHTGTIYMVSLPYSTTFNNLTLSGYYGPEEGTPAFNSGAWAAAQPTADGTRWTNIRVNACNVGDFITGGTNLYSAWNTYSQCYNPSTATNTGAQTCLYFTQGWNDQTGSALSISGNASLTDMYCEPESGPLYGQVPVYEMDIANATWNNMHMGGGGETYIGGNWQHWYAGNFNNQLVFPVLNYGYGNGSDYATVLANAHVSNTYGSSSLINYGQSAAFSGTTDQPGGSGAGPFGANQLGNSREPWHGQDGMTWILGNTTVPFVNENGGYIPASEFNTSPYYESNPVQVPWYYDPTSPSGGTVGCITNPYINSCFSYVWNGQGIIVGPGQRIAAGQNTIYLAVKSTGAASSFTLAVGVCAFGDIGNFTIPVTSTWAVQQIQVDFTGKGSCGGSLGLGFGFSNVADTISIGYVDVTPLAQQFNAASVNIYNQLMLGGSAGTAGQVPTSAGPGSPTVWGAGTGITALTGDVTASGTGSVASTVTRLNGQSLAALATCLLQNTNGTGVPVCATAINVSGSGTFGNTVYAGVNTLASSATPNFDLSLGNSQNFTLTTNVSASTISNWAAGALPYFFNICNPSGYSFPNPTWAQGWTPISTTGCTTEVLYPVSSGLLSSESYNSAFSALSGVSPLAAGNALKGYGTIAVGATSATINTTAIGPQSVPVPLYTTAVGASVSPTVTCNTTYTPVWWSGSSSGNNFTVTVASAVTTNPVCFTWVIANP